MSSDEVKIVVVYPDGLPKEKVENVITSEEFLLRKIFKKTKEEITKEELKDVGLVVLVGLSPKQKTEKEKEIKKKDQIAAGNIHVLPDLSLQITIKS